MLYLRSEKTTLLFYNDLIYLLIPFWEASLVSQLVKTPPAMPETWVGFLGWEDPLEKGKGTHSSILV